MLSETAANPGVEICKGLVYYRILDFNLIMSPDVSIGRVWKRLFPNFQKESPVEQDDKWANVLNSSLGQFLNQLEQTALNNNLEPSGQIPAPIVTRMMWNFSFKYQDRVYQFVRKNNVLELEKREGYKIPYFFSFDQMLAFGALCWGYSEERKVNSQKSQKTKWQEVIDLTRTSLGKNYLSKIIKDPQTALLKAGVVFKRDSKVDDKGVKPYSYEGIRNYDLKDFLETREPWISRFEGHISTEDLVEQAVESLKPDYPLLAEWEFKELINQAFKTGILKPASEVLSRNDARIALSLFFFDKEVFECEAAKGNLEKCGEITLRALGDHPLTRRLKDWQRRIVQPLPIDGFFSEYFDSNDLAAVKGLTLSDLDGVYGKAEDSKTVFVSSIPGFPKALAGLTLAICTMDKGDCQGLAVLYEDLTVSGFKSLLEHCIRKILLIKETEGKERDLGELYKRSRKDFVSNRFKQNGLI